MNLKQQAKLLLAALALTAGLLLVPLGLSHLHRAITDFALAHPSPRASQVH